MLYTNTVYINEDLSSEKFKKLLKHLDTDRRQSIHKYRFEDDKKKSLIAGLLVKSMISERFLISKEKISFSKNCFGKPYITDLPEAYFNVSHSGNYVCCSVSDTEVGIDIEKIDKKINIDIFRNFFSQEEWLQLEKAQNKRQVFYSLWTLKESYIKKIGYGLSKDLDSFTIFLGDKIKLVDYQKEDVDVEFVLRSVNKKYKFSICSEQCEKNIEQEFLLNDFLNIYY